MYEFEQLHEEIDELVQAISEGRLSSDQQQKLQELLSEDQNAREQFIRAMAFEAMLMSEFPAQVSLPDSVTSPLPGDQVYVTWGRVFGSTLAIAALACLLLFGFHSLRKSDTPNGTDGVESDLVSQIATVTIADHPAGILKPGSRLSVGTVDFPAGHSEILFDCGAALSIEGPARLTLENDFRAFLHFGNVAVNVPLEADGFVVQTPTSHIRDLGTSFALRVAENGETELHVLEGSVEATNTHGSVVRKEIVYQEHALFFGEDAVREMTYEGGRFRRPVNTGTLPEKVVHWPLDTLRGISTVDSAGEYSLELRTRRKRDQDVGRIEPTRGVFRGCLCLAGNGQYAISDYYGVGNDRARTIAFWIQIPAQDSDDYGNCLLSWGVPEPQKKWEMGWNRHALLGQVGTLRIDFGKGYVIGSTDLRDGLWHHIAVVFHGGDKADLTTHLKLYVDGKLETITGRRPQRISTLTTSSDSVPVTLGRFIDQRDRVLKSYFRGQFDELYIIEGALTPLQISILRDSNQLK